MKYRILLLLVLVFAIMTSAIGGTLASYTDKAALGFSIEPNTKHIKPDVKNAEEAPTATAQVTEDTTQESAPQETPVETAVSTDEPQQTGSNNTAVNITP
jgi:hypothetical protein